MPVKDQYALREIAKIMQDDNIDCITKLIHIELLLQEFGYMKRS